MQSPSFDGSTGWGEYVRRVTITEDEMFDAITDRECWIDQYLWNVKSLTGEDKVLARLVCFIYFSYVGDGMFDGMSAMASRNKNGAKN